jgi:hypothetical protein
MESAFYGRRACALLHGVARTMPPAGEAVVTSANTASGPLNGPGAIAESY